MELKVVTVIGGSVAEVFANCKPLSFIKYIEWFAAYITYWSVEVALCFSICECYISHN